MMDYHTRIGLTLPDSLLDQAKKAARDARVTLSVYVADSIRVALDQRRRRKSQRPIKIVTSGRGGVLPGVDLSDTASLLDLMDGIKKD